jgi:hypothetical protein
VTIFLLRSPLSAVDSERFYRSGENVRGSVHFLCLPKENEPKERAPVSLARLRRGSLRVLATAGSLQTRPLRGLRQCKLLFRQPLAVLGCVPRGLTLPCRGLPEATRFADGVSLAPRLGRIPFTCLVFGLLATSSCGSPAYPRRICGHIPCGRAACPGGTA